MFTFLQISSANSKKPRVIGTWELNGDEYSIPNLEEYN